MPGKRSLRKQLSEPGRRSKVERSHSAIGQLALQSTRMLTSVDEDNAVCNSDSDEMADDTFPSDADFHAPSTSKSFLKRRQAVAKETGKRRSSEPNIDIKHSVNCRKSLKQVARGMSEMHSNDRTLPIQRNSTRLLSFSGQTNDFSSFLLKDNASLTRYLEELPPDRSLHIVNQRLDVEVEGVYDRFTPLGYAIAENDADMTRTLLRHGADVNGRPNVLRYDENNLSEIESPLHFAALFNCKDEVVDHLLEYGADVDEMSPTGHLVIARFLAGCQAPATIAKLVHILVKGNQPKQDLVDALHFATSRDNEEAVRVILREDFNINERRMCKTPLLLACRNNNPRILQPLLQAAGAGVNDCDQWNRTPLHFAVKHCSKDCLQMLLAAGADVNAEDRSSRSILNYIFLRSGNKLLTKRPEENPGTIIGCLLEASDNNLHVRSPNEFLDALQAVLASETEESVILRFATKYRRFLQPEHRGELLLHTAIRNRKREMMAWLLQERVNSINDPGLDGNWSAIHHAVATKDPGMIQAVLDHGADINTPAALPGNKSGSGITPLCLMIRMGLVPLAEHYIRGGCVVDTSIRLGGLLLIPCTPDDPPLPLELYNPQEVQNGLATAKRNKRMVSLVELALYMDQHKIALLLVEAGALSGANSFAETPGADAAQSRDKILKLVQIKLNQGHKQYNTAEREYLQELQAILTNMSGSLPEECHDNGLAEGMQKLALSRQESTA